MNVWIHKKPQYIALQQISGQNRKQTREQVPSTTASLAILSCNGYEVNPKALPQ